MSKDILKGSFDLHVHAAPDINLRKINVVELAKQESMFKVKGIVVKSHHVPTYAQAETVNYLELGTALYGSLTLNYPICGYFDERIVETGLKMGAKAIFMPTISAAHHLKVSGEDSSRGIRVVDKEGKITLRVKKIVKLVANYDAILATGHISPYEIKALVKEAVSSGVRKVVVTHPTSLIIGMSLEDQIDLAMNCECYMEYCALSLNEPGASDICKITEHIKALGSDHVIITTDLGQPGFPSPAEGMLGFLGRLYEQGIDKDKILRMISGNPARLIGK